jgi:2,4-dienoyl-CoA reductase-like NADH-dependent reductase (Old Yellow Enzyme family)
MILEPNLPNRWLKKVGNAECDCISCNECLTYLLEGNELVTCQAFPKLGEALLRV